MVKREVLDLFVCPMCHSELLVLDVVGTDDRGEIVQGALQCSTCKRIFPIRDGIPFLYSDEIRDFVENEQRLDWSPDDVQKMLRSGDDLETSIVLANIDYHNKAARVYESDYSTRGIFEEGKGSFLRIKNLAHYLAERTVGNVWVDVGCGTGNVLFHASNVFANAIGVDVSVKMLQIARQRGFQVALTDGRFLPFPDQSVDVLSAFSVLHHLPDPTTLLEEAARVLKPGGWFYSDWDPNPHRQRQHPSEWTWLYKVYRKMSPRIKRLLFPAQYQRESCEWYRDPNREAVVSLAEYYGRDRPMKEPEMLRQVALGLGFSDVSIVYHDNADDIFRPGPGKIRTLKRLGHLLLNFRLEWPRHQCFAWKFALLARKAEDHPINLGKL